MKAEHSINVSIEEKRKKQKREEREERKGEKFEDHGRLRGGENGKLGIWESEKEKEGIWKESGQEKRREKGVEKEERIEEGGDGGEEEQFVTAIDFQVVKYSELLSRR